MRALWQISTRAVWQLRLSREGWYYVGVLGFVAGGAAMRQINLLLLLFGFLLGPLLCNAWVVLRQLRSVRATRDIPPVLVAGEPFRVHVKAHTEGGPKKVWAVSVHDSFRPVAAVRSRESLQPAVYFTTIDATPREASYSITLHRRGEYTLGPLKAQTRQPFGLVRSTVDVGQAQSVLVGPALGRLLPRWERWRRAAEADLRERSDLASRVRGEGEFTGMRPWSSGDTRRWIHWRTSARVGSLMVRQFSPPPWRQWVLCLDLCWEDASPTAQMEVEHAVSFAATVVADFVRRSGGSLVVAAAGCAPQTIHGGGDEPHLIETMGMLAKAVGSAEERLLPTLSSLPQTVRSQAWMIVVSPRSADRLRPILSSASTQLPHLAPMFDTAWTIEVGSTEWYEVWEPPILR